MKKILQNVIVFLLIIVISATPFFLTYCLIKGGFVKSENYIMVRFVAPSLWCGLSLIGLIDCFIHDMRRQIRQ